MKREAGRERWEKIVQVSPDLFCAIDRFYTIREISNTCRGMLGYTSQEMEGRHYAAFLHPEDVPLTHQIAHRVLAGRKLNYFESRCIHRNGSTVYLQWSAAWVEEEEVFLCVARDITEQKRSRHRLEESEHRYRLLFENNPDPIFVESIDGLLSEVNQSFCKTFSVSREEAIGLSASSFLSPEMASVSERSLQEALRGSKLRFDLELEVKGKERKVFDVLKYPVVVHGEIIGVKSIAKDITPIVRSYETIRLQARKLNTIFESITDAFLTVDRSWRITYVNSEAETLVHLDRRHHLGKGLWDIFPELVGGEFYTQYHYALETGKSVHFTSFLAKVGLWLTVKVYPSAEGLSIYFEDVTEQVKTRQELKKLSLVASKTSNSVIITDAQGRLEWANEGFTCMTGYTLEETMGKHHSEVFHGPATDKTLVKQAWQKLQKGEPFFTSLIYHKKSGEPYWASIDVNPILDASGEIIQFVALQKDITSQKEAEATLMKITQELYQQNSDMQQFTYIVSHNLRAPVANTLGLTNMLGKLDKQAPEFDITLQYLQESIQRMDGVLRDVNHILSIREKRPVQEKESIRLSEICRQALAELQQSLHQVGGHVNIAIPENIFVPGTRAYLYSVFYNLLSNAIKYRSSERPLQVTVEADINPEEVVRLTFSDNGSGFDEEKEGNNVFKLYKRFHHDREGKGIGLFLVKTHVETMEGRIEVKSQVEKGTTFTIHLNEKKHENLHH